MATQKLKQAPNQDTVVALQEYREMTRNKTEQELADEFAVAQSTMHRWLKRDDVFVEIKAGRWATVFVERVLKQRAVRRKRKG